MITIPIQVTGDAWNNRDAVKTQLDALEPRTAITLDLLSEGPSLHRLGVVDLLSQYDFDVTVTRWANAAETVPFQQQDCNKQSHFFPMALHYWADEIPNDPGAPFKFGLFLGRNTYSRHRILYDCAHKWPNHFLLSKIPNLYSNNWTVNQYMVLEQADEWVDNVEQVRAWFESCPVASIDNEVVQNYFAVPELSAGKLTASLLTHYPKFNIEIVCETYTLGDTFFPTEKTVRPITGNRPFVVYGPRGFLRNLRDTEGFETFGSLWDESYDNLEGVERWRAMCELIESLLKLDTTQWTKLVEQASAITRHNRTVLKKIIDDRKKL